jgi:hypothetical protein
VPGVGATSVRFGGLRSLSALAPKGWRDFFVQVALLGSFEFVYALSGIYGRREATAAVANAHSVAHLESTLGLSWEHVIQTWVLRGPGVLLEVANRTYFISHFTITTAFLLWVYTRHNLHFTRVRNALLAANSVALVFLFAYPLAPPRLVPGSGFVDTLDQNAVNLHSSLIDALNNPYSAMPSLHASYAVVVGVAGLVLARRRWAKFLWALYPALVTYSVIATGNHFVLDVLAGVAALLATPLVDRAASFLAPGTVRRRAAATSLNIEREWA